MRKGKREENIQRRERRGKREIIRETRGGEGMKPREKKWQRKEVEGKRKEKRQGRKDIREKNQERKDRERGKGMQFQEGKK